MMKRLPRGQFALAAASFVALTAAPARASDVLFAQTSLANLQMLGNRLDQAREPPLLETDTLVAAYAQSNDKAREAAIDAVPGVALAAPPRPVNLQPSDTRSWATTYVFGGRTGADARGPALTSSGAGVMAGVDRLLDPTLLAGVVLGFANTHSASARVRQDFDTFSGGAYVSWAPLAGWELDGYLGGTWVELDSTRFPDLYGTLLKGTLGPVDGESSGPGVSVAASAGYRLRTSTSFGEAFAKPFATLAYVGETRRAYVESNPVGASLSFPRNTLERTNLNLGVAAGLETRAGEDWTLRSELRVAWSRYLTDPSPAVPAFLSGAPVSLTEPDPGRDGALVSLEVTGFKRREVQAFAGYTGEFRTNAIIHQGRGGVRVAW
jgi:uncharacterized protein with beta-barrel porin domain